MRILVLGAGGVGGYFGGRLLQAGGDVTFLVRERRAGLLRRTGLVIRSPLGDFAAPVEPVTREQVRPEFDLALLSCKAYDLEDAIASLQGGLAPHGRVVPLLNGLAHMERLDAAFGAGRVVGGLCHISVTLGADGAIEHLNRLHRITYGERGPETGAADLALLDRLFRAAGVEAEHSTEIMRRTWEKLVLLATLAALTCLMRGSIGAILKSRDGRAVILETLEACRQVAAAAGYPPTEAALAATIGHLTDETSALKASMLRDIERGNPTEGEHIVGDMVRLAESHGISCPPLRLAYAHLQTYEALRTTG
ncbi:MAG: 2-dehydropantoate 2-reductase [Rhodospirillaceae bacterium]